MNEREKELLEKIVKDRYSVGAFSGMVFNAHLKHSIPVEDLILTALRTRLTMEDMAK